MALSDAYLDYLHDLLGWLPRLRIKRMFGGAGLYSDDCFFAIADDGVLYLKADNGSLAFYRQGGAEQFCYASKGKVTRMNFWSLPADVQEDPDQLRLWIGTALDTALRGKK